MHGKGMAALTLTQDGTTYFDDHHSTNDTLNKVDSKQLDQNVAVYAAFTYMTAQAQSDFGSALGAFANDGASKGVAEPAKGRSCGMFKRPKPAAERTLEHRSRPAPARAGYP